MRHRSSLEANRQPLVRAPAVVIAGNPGIVSHEVMADRRHVLTQDTWGRVALWDVLSGAPVTHYGKVDFDAKRRELWEAVAVPAWFSSDTRLGCLAITLEPPGCFAAEEYAACLEYGNVPDDFKVNFGRLVLECAFAKWRRKVVQSLSGGGADARLAGAAEGGGGPAPCPYYPEPWPKFWQCKALP
ncbi:WD repeat domain-containing protein, partial [Tetrabaena socialis]